MLGTGLSCGLAAHNLAARRTPTSRTRTPATRLTMARQSALRILAPILIKHPLQTLPLNNGGQQQLQSTAKISSHPNHATQSPTSYEVMRNRNPAILNSLTPT